MPTRVQNPFFARHLMVLCLGTGMLVIAMQGQQIAVLAQTQLSQLQQTLLPTPKPSPSQSAVTPKSEVKVVVDLSDRRVRLYRRQQLKASYPVAIGQEGWETPIGTFQVTQMQRHPKWRHPITGKTVPPGKDNPLGERWIEFWSDGRLAIGFHGTNQEALIGQAVSHGCLRLKNADVRRLYEQVSLGTLIEVRK